MGTRLALLGGIYSNYLALEAALRHVRRRGADLVWCLGDLGGFGPHPDRAAEILRGHEIPMLRGNYDDSIGCERDDCACGYTDPGDNDFAQISYDYTLANTAPGHRAWMRDLPEQQRLEIAGRRVLLCHGSPRQVNEFLWESTCSDAFLEWLCEHHGADVVACAHSGLPWHRKLPSGRHVVNAGVIGRPANDGRAEVWYLALELDEEVHVEFHPVGYDVETLAREMARESLPPQFIETIRTGWWTTCLENLPAKERRRGRH
jgi:predicted phosphodiesterase